MKGCVALRWELDDESLTICWTMCQLRGTISCIPNYILIRSSVVTHPYRERGRGRTPTGVGGGDGV